MEALDTYDAARLPVPASSFSVVSGDTNQRQRFQVELAPGETTLVWWKELVQEANNEVVSDDSSGKALVQEANTEVISHDTSNEVLVQEAKNEVVSPDSFDQDKVDKYIQVEKSRIEDCSVVEGDKVQHQTGRKESSKSSKVQGKKTRKEILDSVTSAAHQKLHEKKSAEHDLQQEFYELEGFTHIERRNNKGRNKLRDLNLPYRDYAPGHQQTKSTFTARTDETCGKT